MGSGSSRSSRVLRRLRGPHSRPAAGPSGAAPEGVAAAPEESPEAAAGGAAGSDPGSAAPPDGRDETLRLLDQLLAESAAWDPGALAPPPRPAAGSRVSPEQGAEDHPGNSSRGSGSEAPGSSPKKPERRSVTLYDYSEEELMASIEQECCR